MWVGLAVGFVAVSLLVPGASGRAVGWSSGQYRDSLNQALASGMIVSFDVSATKITNFAANIKFHCASTCSGPEIRNLALRLPGAISISANGKFHETASTTASDVSASAPATVSVDAQLKGKSATGTVQYSSVTVDGDQYSGGDIPFAASLHGAQASMFRAYGDVVADATPPYAYVEEPISVDFLAINPDQILASGARSFEWWISPSVRCKPRETVAEDNVPADGRLVVSQTYKFPNPGIYTICAELLDSQGNPVTPAGSFPPPWTLNPILICLTGARISYNPAVGLGCKGGRPQACSRRPHTNTLDADHDTDVNHKGVYIGPPDGDSDDCV